MIYLASQSPRRRELLRAIGLSFTPLLFRNAPRADVAVNETPQAHEPPLEYAERVARAKAEHGRALWRQRGLPALAVLAADTTLDVDGEIIGKPRDAADAKNILQRLSGRAHRVITAVAIATVGRDDAVALTVNVSEVRFRTLSEAEIVRYLVSGEAFDKAGAYGIQGRAAIFVERINGSHSGIAGLPLCETALLLRSVGVDV